MTEERLIDLLLPEEQGTLARLNIELQVTGLIFRRELNESEMRESWWILAGLRHRSGDKDDRIKFVIGDWMLTAEKLFGKKTVKNWIEEVAGLRGYRDHLLMLTGATLIQLQSLELIINACCSFLDLNDGKKKIEIKASDLLSPDAAHRGKTLGVLKNGLLGTRAFDEVFEKRLASFVKHRNRFIHNYWVDTLRDSTKGGIPTLRKLKEIEKFIVSLLKETTALHAPFRGLFYSIGKGMTEQSKRVPDLTTSLLLKFRGYEEDFLSVLRRPEENRSGSK